MSKYAIPLCPQCGEECRGCYHNAKEAMEQRLMAKPRIRIHYGGGLWWAVVTWPDGYGATTWLNTCVRAVMNQANLWLRPSSSAPAVHSEKP